MTDVRRSKYGSDMAESSESPTHLERLSAVRPRLLSFTRLHLIDKTLAEDTVQEAMLSAYEKGSSFSGRSGYETWVFGILKYKILDAIQAQKRFGFWQSLEDDAIAHQFQQSGRWEISAQPSDWGKPDLVYENEHFWQIFDACMLHLSDNLARVFSLRELMGLSTQEVCRVVGIRENHCAVLLHRARLKLRACIESRWLGETLPC
ncbi:sigma-70 family RNA polymerase sigma factor [Halomonas sp. HK25]|uniref:sigma-70 family RNA polymerase sigma factor n=1 Tax=Halomonas sp. HK25 TaxID=3394321 RepID=UPI0039FD7D6D